MAYFTNKEITQIATKVTKAKKIKIKSNQMVTTVNKDESKSKGRMTVRISTMTVS